ncbi:hypothetical protein [Pseudonocardia sp. GCM10023141]|uniref:hypothetical protein n=1 Tax=Pseudonocardia sp. GCM10023141 TaxID=3252653 RepID=UPI00362327D1
MDGVQPALGDQVDYDFTRLDTPLIGEDAQERAIRHSRSSQKPQVERPEDEHDPEVHQQPAPELVPEEQDIHADHHRDQQ